jgi:hypothetical protein
MSSATPTADEPVDDEERELLDEVAMDERNQDEIEAAMGGNHVFQKSPPTSFSSHDYLYN